MSKEKEVVSILPNFNAVMSNCTGKTREEQKSIVRKELIKALASLEEL